MPLHLFTFTDKSLTEKDDQVVFEPDSMEMLVKLL